MKHLKFLQNPLIYLTFVIVSCTSDDSATPDVKSILTAEKWYFFSINGGEAYPCVKQTNLDFSNDGTLVIETYIRTPVYTCEGPVVTTYNYTLENNNTAIKWGNNVYSIAKLTDTEFIKTKEKEGVGTDEWLYLRYKN